MPLTEQCVKVGIAFALPGLRRYRRRKRLCRFTIQNAERYRMRQPGEQAGKRRIGLVMQHNILFADSRITKLYHFQLQRLQIQAQTLLILAAKQHWPAMLQMQLRFSRTRLVGKPLEDTIIVNNAILKDFNERSAAMSVRALQDFGQMLAHGINRTRNKTRTRAEGK